MGLVGFEGEGGGRLGIVDADAVIDLQAVDPRVSADLGEWLRANGGDLAPLHDLARRAGASARRPPAQLRFRLPVARPRKNPRLGLHYLAHAQQGGPPRPQVPSVLVAEL